MRLAAILTVFPLYLCAQSNLNTITVTATADSAAAPDQASYSLTVTAPADRGLNAITAPLASLGITAKLVSIYGGFSTQPRPVSINWIFQFQVSLDSMPATTAALAALQQTISANDSSMSLTFDVESSQSPAPACDLAALMADARGQAQKIAAAAGSVAPAVTGLTSSTGSAGTCSLTVTFALGYQGQPGPHTITVNAYRTLSAAPDQVVISLEVSSPRTAALSDVASALSKAGVAGATFTGLSSESGTLHWSFSLTAPVATLTNTVAALLNAQQNIGAGGSGLSLTTYIESLQASPQSRQRCEQADLIAGARTHAERVAAAAGVSAGSIVGIGPPSPAPPVAAFAYIADFIPVSGFLAVPFQAPQTTCSLAVQFLLL
jgi:uncharacterized protein YggE